MSTFRVKRKLIFRDPFAVLFRPRSSETLCCADRCIRVLAATEALLTLLFLVGSTFWVSAQIGSSQSQGEQSAQRAVKTTYEAYLRAWKNKDFNALDHILSDDYQAVNFQGFVSTKSNEIATAKKDRTYVTMNGHVISVVIFGDNAVASGLIEASWKDPQGNLQSSTFRFLAMLLRQKGDWRLVATQSTKFNRPAEPEKK